MPAIANNKILKIDFFLDELNNKQLPTERYRAIWISYDYDDIRYLIVPDTGERINLIKTILALPDNLFNGTNDVVMSKNVLISKIIVLDELGEDL